MTRKERLTAVFWGKPVDRAPVKLWNVIPGQELLHPAYAPVYRAGIARTDLMVGAGSRFDLLCGAHSEGLVHRREEPTDSAAWVHVITEIEAPGGTLRCVRKKSTCKRPGYEAEYLLKTPQDLEKLLALPYKPFPFAPDAFLAKEKQVGDAGVVVYGLDHAMYGLQRLIGSENFALWSFEYRDLFLEIIERFSQRLCEHVKEVFAGGLRPFFGWVGPELCIPPLMSTSDFDVFTLPFDKRLCDVIHDGGGRVWVHCHGKMRAMLERFVAMGVDVLNPIEPPPMGDVSFEQAFGVVGNRMALEGNIECHDLMTASLDELREKLEAAVAAGSRPGRRFILCATSGYMEDPTPTDTLLRNLMFYIEEGIRLAEDYAA